ncbi:MAG: hypothetical protein R2724_27910 [Bryobacterales bacterium]
MTRLPLILVALLSASIPAGSQTFGGFVDAEVQTLPREDTPGARASLSMTVILLKGSNWSEKRVRSHIERTRKIFAACEVAIGPITFVKASAPDHRHDLEMSEIHPKARVPQDVFRLSKLLPRDAHWPVAIFAGRLLGDNALARSYGRGAVEPGSEPDYPYMNTAWFAFKTHWIERRDREYSSLAHELTHLLCECGHESRDFPHMMHTHLNMLSSRILPEHCEFIATSPLLTHGESQ